MKLSYIHENGLCKIESPIYKDERGAFMEAYHYEKLKEIFPEANLKQINQSYSKKGVIRGLHFQREPHAQAKLVWVPHGKVYDVAVDLREGSPTYGKCNAEILSSENGLMLYVPKGYAHGFAALEDSIFMYLCSDLYHPQSEGGYHPYSKDLNIDWPVKHGILSEKDAALPLFEKK
ncbi:MAG: dTDP-4-dehydrorhamnose 3,5-epimerase [Cyclobacteriaceae bacterium]|nr:dTDP-4-dehydrorhamnose 3,5-epimerase [Cyclobacteriaceae bacterium]MCH8515085.1 dTDP-4-dehydrorhamnose 3,5-epimerase [Cyclobacteriaceae bacterium]